MTAAVAALVPPLEHRLADDRLNALHELARSARPGLEDLRPEGRAAHDLVRELARRTGGRVALVSPAGRVLVDSDPDARSLLPRCGRRAARHAPACSATTRWSSRRCRRRPGG